MGKTTLLDLLPLRSRLFLDDLAARDRAQRDPALTLDAMELPCLIDEAQYAPNLFPEIKSRIDRARRANIRERNPKTSPSYYLTGSNRLLIDNNVKESLAGRVHMYELHGLSVREISSSFPDLPLKRLLLRGGFPELFTRQDLSPQRYLNDYLLSFVEKDIARSAGVEKLDQFHTLLRLLAAYTGQFIQVSELAAQTGVDSHTVQSWIAILRQNFILDLLPPFHSNLSKRVVKMKKLFFMDVGLCARLQGHQSEDPLWGAPQVGSLFETLVFSEIVKTKTNFLLEGELFTWRTKEKNEIDFVIDTPTQTLFIEAKLGIHGASSFELDSEAKRTFKKEHRKIVAYAGKERLQLDRSTECVPIQQLGDYLRTVLS